MGAASSRSSSAAQALSLRHYDCLRDDLADPLRKHAERFPDYNLVRYAEQVDLPDSSLVVLHNSDLWYLCTQVATSEAAHRQASTPSSKAPLSATHARRRYKALSQTAVAKQAGITQGHYSKIENGLLEPGDENVRQLAQVLDCPEGFFYQADRVVGLPVSVHPMFRKRSSVGTRALEQLEAGLNLQLIAIRRLLKSVDLQPQFKLPRLDVDAFEGDVDEIARLVRAQWLVPRGPITNLTELVEQAGCIVVHCDLPGKVDGVTLCVTEILDFGMMGSLFTGRQR